MNVLRIHTATTLHGLALSFRMFSNAAISPQACVRALEGEITDRTSMPVYKGAGAFSRQSNESRASASALLAAITQPEDSDSVPISQARGELFASFTCASIAYWPDQMERSRREREMQGPLETGQSDPLAIARLLDRGGLLITVQERVMYLYKLWDIHMCSAMQHMSWHNPRERTEKALARQARYRGPGRLQSIQRPMSGRKIGQAPGFDRTLKHIILSREAHIVSAGSTGTPSGASLPADKQKTEHFL
jgi:hypothetical protein